MAARPQNENQMAGKLKFSLQEYQEAAVKYRKELLMLPIIGCDETLKYMTGRPGIRYKERVGFMSGSAQFAPYKPKRRTDVDLQLDFRTLETFFGSVVADFEPNTAVTTLLGAVAATKGDGQKLAPSAKNVLALIAKGLSENLNNSLWTAKRNADGDTTMDLFDGWDTITEQEVADGNIAEDKGNLILLGEPITTANAVSIAKGILYSLDPHLRKETCYLYCSQDFADKYNEGYLLTHAGIPYNTQFQQTVVEGSGGKLILCPLANKDGSKYMQVSPKFNMLYGYDQMGDIESIDIKEFAPFVLSYIATMFFGVQFESIDKRRLMVVKLSEGSEASTQPVKTGGSQTIDNQGTGTTITQ